MTRSWCVLAVLLVLLAATATSAIKPLEDAPQEDHLAHGLLPQEEEPAARIASGLENLRPADKEDEPAARIASGPEHLRPAENKPLEEAPQDSENLRLVEKKEGGGDGAMPMEAKPTSGVAIQNGDPGTVPSAGSGNGNDNSNGSGSGEHGKGESAGSGKEAEKSAGTKSCLTKEECHKKRLICGKGCTLSAHAKCAAKCSKSCVPTC
ncbi:unnamed protein product [Alopecurus aequalis]